MPREQGRILDAKDTFPELAFSTVEDETLHLPGDFEGSWGIVLFYRGEW